MRRKVGIVGYGHLGQHLAHKIIKDERVSKQLEIGFIWNRSVDKIKEDKLIPESVILENLSNFDSVKVDIIIEVAHPSITLEYGERFLQHADFLVGSPTVFANAELESKLRNSASQFGCYIPSGALWGAEDIEKMADLGTLKGLTITMKKHPSSLKVESPLSEKLQSHYQQANPSEECILYEGPVRELCPLAPNNVNTMACAALAAHNLGFDKVKARLVADSRLQSHVIEIDVEGPRFSSDENDVFSVKTVRDNPAKPGAVTGNATYDSFLISLLRAKSRGSGFHLC